MSSDIKKIGAGFGIMLLKDGKILLGKRNDDPTKADSALSGEGTWTMPGGKLEYGEQFEAGARRELAEETGMTLNWAKVICVENCIGAKAHFVTIGILAEDFSGEPRVMEPDEITEWKWFELDNLPGKLFLPSKYIIERYKDNTFYKTND